VQQTNIIVSDEFLSHDNYALCFHITTVKPRYEAANGQYTVEPRITLVQDNENNSY